MDHLAARGFELDIGDSLHAVGNAVAQLHRLDLVRIVAQDQLALFQSLVVLGRRVILPRATQAAANVIAIFFERLFIDPVGDAGGVGRSLGRLALEGLDQTLGLRVAVLFGLRGERQRLVGVSRLHRLLGIQIEGLRHTGLGLVTGGLGGRAVADKLQRLLVLFAGQREIAGGQRRARGLERSKAMTVQRLATDRLQRNQLRDQT